MPANLIFVAQVAGAFGVRGELRLTAFTEDPLSLVDYGVLLGGTGTPALTIETGRSVKGALICRAKEVVTREQAQAMRGLKLYIGRSSLPPPVDEDEFYLADLVGLAAVSPSGEPLGSVKFVANFGAGDLLEVQPPTPGAATWYAPFTKAVVPNVDLTNGMIIIDPPVVIESDRESYEQDDETVP